MIRQVSAIVFLVLFMYAGLLKAQSITEPSGVTISVTKAGAFTIQNNEPGWTYSGNISGRVSTISGPITGSDASQVSTNGPFDEFTVSYLDSNGMPWTMQLRAYHSVPSATISFSPLVAVANPGPMAVFHQFPITPHHYSSTGWGRSFGLVGWMGTDSPWLFFDNQFNSSILSAASRPISQRQVWIYDQTTNGEIALEIDSSNPVLPAGDVYTHLITFGQGIGSTFNRWGSTLRNMFGRPLTSNEADLSLRIPMLSTDAGASYYYNYDSSLGYEGTLQAAIASAKSVGIPLGIVHFDSWWYLKGGNCDSPTDPVFASWKENGSGSWKYVADPALFPPINASRPEAGFVQTLGAGMAHGRWVDTCSPYRLPIRHGSGAPFQPVSGNVITDLGIWERIAYGLKQSNMVIYEQDWLSSKAKAADTFDDEKFLDNMAAAMGKFGLDLQLCMPLARHLLQSFKYQHVHTVRVSSDRFGWKDWDQEMYGSMILNAGSVWPSVDNFQTTETRNLLLGVLSAGPLALSDPIGSFVPIPQAIRGDGLILKPDVPMVPTDASFVTEAEAVEQYYGINGPSASNPSNTATLILPPLIGHSETDFASGKVEYVFAYSRNQNGTEPVSFSPQDFGFNGSVYVYDYFGKTGWWQPAAQAISRTVDSQGSYFVITPMGASGIAFVGDLSRFVPASHERISSLGDNGTITATVQFNPPETVFIAMFAAAPPVVSVQGGTVSAPTYDSTTGLYQVAVTSAGNSQATMQVSAGPPVTQ